MSDFGDPLHGRSDPTSYWSTTNLAEAYPGVLTPMDWTVAGPATEAATRAALHAIGALTLAERAIPSEPEERIFNVFFGRIATRVGFFCEVGDRMPGTTGPAVADQIFGFLPPGVQARPSRRRYPVIAAKFPVAFGAAPSRSRRARDRTAAWWPGEIERAPGLVLEQARAQFAAALQRFTLHLTVDGIALLAGTQPVCDHLWRLADAAGVRAADLVSGYGSHEESELINDLWACSRGRIDLETLTGRYGYHGPDEGQVSAVVWREDAGPLERAVKAYESMPDDADPIAAARARAVSRTEAVRGFLAALPASKRPAAQLLLRAAQIYVPLRGKVGRLQALDVVRAAARRVGVCLAENGDLADPADVFFLTAVEVTGSLPGGARELVARRRELYEHYGTLGLPRSWQGNPDPVAADQAPDEDRSGVRGIGVSPGVAEGRVRVITDPATEEIEPGEILVARTTDPGWAALMFASAAMVVEIGGRLSHAAVVARELGVPCVMGVDGATTTLHTGDRCRVDGATGEVTVLEEMTSAPNLVSAAWLRNEDERPHAPENVPYWSENYLTYLWSPGTQVGVYFHVTRLPGALARWDEIMFVALPDGRWLASRSTSPQRDVDGVEVNGIQWICDVPFQAWTKRFRGVAQLVTIEDLEAGPLPDGYNIPVDLEVACSGLSVTYHYGTAHLEQSWATGHYEQHLRVEGRLRYGNETVAISGTGLRDHSWGPRDYTKLGYSTWITGQFPKSGRCFMAVRVTGVPPAPELVYGLTCDRDGRYDAMPSELRIARTFTDSDSDYQFQLTAEDGSVSTIRAEILRSTRCSFHGAAQMVLGIDRRPIANHHYVDAFTRFEWDGEVGYGVTEYTVDLYPGSRPPDVPW